MSDIITSLIRTIVPMIVGAIVTFFASNGVTFDAEFSGHLYAVVQGLISALYYFIVRLLERKYPIAGVLLGSTKQPEYTTPEHRL